MSGTAAQARLPCARPGCSPAADREGVRRCRPRPGGGDAYRRDEALPGDRHRPAARPRGAPLRREPRPGGEREVRARCARDARAGRRSDLDAALHRSAPEQQGGATSPATPTSSQSVDRRQARRGPRPRAPHAGRPPARGACSRSSLDDRPADGGRPASGAARPTLEHWRTRSQRRGPAPAARRHGGRAARGRPATRPSPGCARSRTAYGTGTRGRRLDLGRHERRPRGGGAPRRDTPACRDRNPRFAAVTSCNVEPSQA